jgi:hypothetical protein
LGDDLRPHWVWTITTGRVPVFEGVERDQDLERFRALKGRSPGWYEALGHDVARLGQLSIPEIASDDDATAAETHRRIHDALVAATLDGLWTSARERFSPKRRLQHTFRVVRVLPPEAP